jgi:hypothetical protein
MRTSASVAFVVILLGVCSCESYYPVGDHYPQTDASDWEGTWVATWVDEGSSPPEIGTITTSIDSWDRETGQFAVSWTVEDYQPSLITSTGWLWTSKEVYFGNLLIIEHPWFKYLRKGNFVFARIDKFKDFAFVWPPNSDRFREFIDAGQLPGETEKFGFKLGKLESKHIEFLSSDEGRLLFGPFPIVFRRIDR